MSFLRRWTTEEGRQARLFERGLKAWAESQLISPAPNREFETQLPLGRSEGSVHCYIKTSLYEYGGQNFVAIEASRMSDGQIVVTIVLDIQGEYVQTIWP